MDCFGVKRLAIVSKKYVINKKLDIYNSQTGVFVEIDNTKAAIRRHIRALGLSENLYVVIDLTGGYEALCVNEFYSKGYNVIRAEGLKVKSFAWALGINAKIDDT